MRGLTFLFGAALFLTVGLRANASVKHRIVISTDIGGTDPDDNQSMTHLMMYSDCFEIEGLVSSASFGKGSKEEILRMVDVYEKDFGVLQNRYPGLMSPDALRLLCKQGKRGLAPYAGFDTPTEGSEWIVRCARKESDRPLYVLVWGTLEDVAQALHDAPDIVPNIRVYWIGGPNKKWGVNSYAYIARNFPDLWMIENNASYRGFIRNTDLHLADAGHLGADFQAYYRGLVKMGDTPSLLYLMHGNPDDPQGESWGGSFEPIHQSPYTLFTGPTTEKDTVSVYSLIEFRLEGPVLEDRLTGTSCFTFLIDGQSWDGVYLGAGMYGVRYAAKKPDILTYKTRSEISELDGQTGKIVVSGMWPGDTTAHGIPLGSNWYTDKSDPALFDGVWQGSMTVGKWTEAVLSDWAERWGVLKGVTR